MLCASELLLRIYVIINCIKQISILLDTEGIVWLPSWNLRRGQFCAVTVPRLPLPDGTVDNYGQATATRHPAFLLYSHTAVYYLVFRYQLAFLTFINLHFSRSATI
jgi:hypothetical protein